MILAGSSAGLTQGPDGASHQSLEDIAVMRSLPKMTVLVPADAIEAHAMTLAAVREIPGPVYLRLGRYSVPNVVPVDYVYRHGKAVTLRAGADVTLIACGHMVAAALAASDLLAAQGVTAGVVNMSTIKPLDVEAVQQAAEHHASGGDD